MINVFIIGSKGIPARYGGFETFVEKLTGNKKCEDIKYHIACLDEGINDFIYNNARCFNVRVENMGSAKAVIYDIKAIIVCVKYIRKNKLKNCIIYILACRIGPFMCFYKKRLKLLGIKAFVNPDGHEWKRNKWNKLIRVYWKISERFMIKNADLLICDSVGIEDYIKREYFKYNPATTYIAYGAEVIESIFMKDIESFNNWKTKNNVKENEYYLVVGRFVPENNYETIIKEFMKSQTKKDLILITNAEHNKFYKYLLNKTKFDRDARIKFVGTIYDEELLKKIREEAFAYIHGHEVGGTNPSLLEALASTKLNLILDVSFNREVAGDGTVYFMKDEGNLSNLINSVDNYTSEYIEEFSKKAKDRIIKNYSWHKIVNEYEDLFIRKGTVN